MRQTLVAALLSCADDRRQAIARRFLQGLSSDELQYIAEFLGAWILEGPACCAPTRAQLAESLAVFQRGHGMPQADADHKMILVLEYLCRCGVNLLPAVAVRAARA